jgi:PPK2 family polyphosphate:nucleotide phosphotransferase
MTDYRDRLRVKPGSKVRLKDVDPGYHGEGVTTADAAAMVAAYERQLELGQLKLYAESRRSLLIVLQGLDASGKDGVCRHVLDAFNPLGTTVSAFKQPTPAELAHDFLWRVHARAPGKGEVAVFNRSHYEDVLVVRVHGLVPRKVWSRRYEQINEFERQLGASGTTILKFFLYISKDEQLERFRDRLEDPRRNWKISLGDYEERSHWDEYIEAYEEALERCSTDDAPWYVIPSNRKWFRDLAVSQILCATLEDMNLRYPEPSVDLEEVRRQYHLAAAGDGGRKKVKPGKGRPER